MTTNINTKRIGVGLFLTAAVAFGTFAPAANADEYRGEHRGEYHHRGWNGGYYRAPPVVYGTPYYAPPVVYGPGFGINLNIR